MIVSGRRHSSGLRYVRIKRRKGKGRHDRKFLAKKQRLLTEIDDLKQGNLPGYAQRAFDADQRREREHLERRLERLRQRSSHHAAPAAPPPGRAAPRVQHNAPQPNAAAAESKRVEGVQHAVPISGDEPEPDEQCVPINRWYNNRWV